MGVQCVGVCQYVVEVGAYKCVGDGCLCDGVEWYRYVGIYRSVEWSSFSSNSNSSMELKLHHPLIPSYIYPHTHR